MVELDWTRCRLAPFAHQRVGTTALVRHPAFALFDSMGLGKSKQTIDAAGFLFEAGEVDTLLVLCPAGVRPVWLDRDFGEVAVHAFTPYRLLEYHARTTTLALAPPREALSVVVTNYEFIRQEARRNPLIAQLRGRRVMMVLDESSEVKGHRSQQTRAAMAVRRAVASRAVLLNGTPISQSPLDLYAQFAILDPRIIGAANYFVARNRYAVMGGYLGKQVVAYQHLDDLNARVAPYILTRTKDDCPDLPSKSYTEREAPLDAAAWSVYEDMRRRALAWLSANVAAVAPQAAGKALRLAQIASGFVGGLTRLGEEEALDLEGAAEVSSRVSEVRTVHAAKRLALLSLLRQLWHEEPAAKVLVWARFQEEVRATAAVLREAFPNLPVATLYGKSDEDERASAIAQLDPRRADDRRAVVVGTPKTGGVGLNLTAAHVVVYLSNDFNLRTRLQSEDRVHRPGQTRNVRYVDIIAVGPQGQRTVDHGIVAALRRKEDIARWSAAEWRHLMTEGDRT